MMIHLSHRHSHCNILRLKIHKQTDGSVNFTVGLHDTSLPQSSGRSIKGRLKCASHPYYETRNLRNLRKMVIPFHFLLTSNRLAIPVCHRQAGYTTAWLNSMKLQWVGTFPSVTQYHDL